MGGNSGCLPAQALAQRQHGAVDELGNVCKCRGSTRSGSAAIAGRGRRSAAWYLRCAAADVLTRGALAFARHRHEWPLKFSWSYRSGVSEAAAAGLKRTNHWVKV